MTDNDDTDPRFEQENRQSEQIEREVTERIGRHGEKIVRRRREKTDVEGMVEQVDTNVAPLCECGDLLLKYEDMYECCECRDWCCTECRIKKHRYNYCPDCIRREYGVNKAVYTVLYLLKEDAISLTDLIDVQTVDGEPVAVRVDDAITTLVERGYVRRDNTDAIDGAAAVSDNDKLSVKGKEALSIGDQLYGDDRDIKKMKQDVSVLQASKHGH